MKNVRMINLSSNVDNYGKLVPIEGGSDLVPFDVKRVYYIYGVEDGVRRGFHAHYDLEQVLICVHGSVKILVKTPDEEQEIVLDSPEKGLYIGSMIWREMYDFEDEAVLLVLASKHYAVEDYIRDYDEYAKIYKKEKEKQA